ncbi:MAG: hypothetical protein GF329_08800 [Candidatus Lokiarchaeota archaeon]|nr:hypothetical protein [Candidatus Lokiarchaeota archaeon]
MKLDLTFDKDDIRAVNTLKEKYGSTKFVKKRNELIKSPPELTKETIWKQLITCLCTSQQRSGRNSNVGRFIRLEPFPLRYNKCKDHENLEQYISETLSNNKIRFYNNISRYAKENLKKLESGEWDILIKIFKDIQSSKAESRRTEERKASRYIQDEFLGFGPKQSRHLLLGLGLAYYEIPLDSRILNWINDRLEENKIPRQALSDEQFFCFLLDKISITSNQTSLLPTEFDALIFESVQKTRYKS